MYQELDVYLGKNPHKVFLQRGFYPHTVPAARLHRHNYTDVHVVSGGEMVFCIGQETYTAGDGTLLVIPGGVLHCCRERGENTIHSAFQIDHPVDGFFACKVNPDSMLEFFGEIARAEETGDYSVIAAHIGWLCSRFCKENPVLPRQITDYGFLIHEFFQNQYSRDVRLCDLARELKVCDRQAERLIRKYTGRTFRDELAVTRITMARQLLKGGGMTAQEIALYIGYRSYAGFWKAARKYGGLSL